MIGTRLGPWLLVRELGQGGMGTVYLARRAVAEDGAPARAAVKVLSAELSGEEGFRQRFQREIDVLRQLEHPHIVRFFEAGADRGRFWYAMELVEGPSLQDVLRERGRLPWPEVLALACQIAPALKHAHDRGVVHRDLKPANLLLEGGEGAAIVKLADFGIASLFASPHLTVTGGVIGTPEYLSPEQAAGKQVTRRSDLYSLGVVLYTLLTGRPPFEGEPMVLMHKHLYAQFESPSRLVPDLPPDLDAIVCELLEKSPDKRPADGGVLFRRLDRLHRKMERKARGESEDTAVPPSATRAQASSAEGPATLMSRLMRAELEQQKSGGPIRRFFNRPAVLVPLLLLTLGTIAWAFWPTGPERLYQRGAALMASSDPDDWDRAWDRYLEPLERKYPNHAHKAEVADLRRQYEERRVERKAEQAARRAGPQSEGQWFYQEGLRKRLAGDEEGARRTWQALVDAYFAVPAERPWVRLAEAELGTSADKKAVERQWQSLDEAVRRARGLEREGKKDEAKAALDGLRALYRNDPPGRKALEKALARPGG
jgi:serine/threonine-protein kinase